MKVLILAGGFGTRLSEETDVRPKPMVEIGGKPILWHIMKIYSHYGFNEFVILLGYKGYYIKEYFAKLDTGVDTMTGGRIKRAKKFIGNKTFMLTYGDGVADIDIKRLLNFHKSHGKAIAMTSVQPEGRFGALSIEDENKVTRFLEKPKGDGAWINGGFFVCEPKVLDYITEGDATIFERTPLENLAKDGELYTYKHTGFWKCMDTLRDKIQLNKMWDAGKAKWKIWK